jgi:hypothetical protein
MSLDLVSLLSLRSILIFFSTAFSLILVMLFLNIITVDEIALILKLSPEATNALKLVISRIQEVSTNILEIISQLLNKLLGWAGVDVDLSKIKIDANQTSSIPSSTSISK